MLKTTERNLSLVIALATILVFALTLAGVFINNALVGLLWNGLFLLSWLMMLAFGLIVLFDKKAMGFSILTGIITGLAFCALSAHSLVILARFIPQISGNIILPNIALLKHSQMIFYTSLILVYFIHIINYIRLNPQRKLETSLDNKDESIESDKTVDVKETEDSKNTEGKTPENRDRDLSEEDLKILNSHKDPLDFLGDEEDKNGSINNGGMEE
ncbi:Uncharacterised protein [Anaerococcus prevotii]|uniref:Uncharacterized protein n=1 Tax=Anaerococcus prevotii (strain ATCC 9321 / DSM 20548 / JCM 6508 / NCTC 11806 / PC1) TaxID=525919 RepID=C7RE77_ANAPD|nr:hypothetical protein [Anaerococcus prevotii]ACV29490.1 hypothetical protein Apre_1469 [Anaerococcus prevotii DSM 20548]SUU95164.1 Uncharacterised protein [Anaerococcus prevotii]